MLNGHPGPALVAWRSKNGVTQRELGIKIGVNDQMISNYEMGRNTPSLVTAFALERVTGIDAELWALWEAQLRGKAA